MREMAAEGCGGDKEEVLLPLFESKQGKCSVAYRVFALKLLVGTCLILFYRLLYIPRAGEGGRWAWLGMFMAELCFGFYWFICLSLRWNSRFSFPHKNRLSQRFIFALSYHIFKTSNKMVELKDLNSGLDSIWPSSNKV